MIDCLLRLLFLDLHMTSVYRCYAATDTQRLRSLRIKSLRRVCDRMSNGRLVHGPWMRMLRAVSASLTVLYREVQSVGHSSIGKTALMKAPHMFSKLHMVSKSMASSNWAIQRISQQEQ